MLVLKMIKKIKIWNIIKYVVVKASIELMPEKLTKTKKCVNFRPLYEAMPSLPHRFFWWI